VSRARSTHGSEEDFIQGTDGKDKGNKPLRKYRRRWEDIIKMDLREIKRGGIDWIHLAYDRD
jgi:hypothetical protein